MPDRSERRDRTTRAGAWQEAPAAVSLEDAATAAALAREVATPFGFKRPAAELLARFGGDTPDGRRRATAALTVAGIAADPPLDTVKPQQWVQLRAATAVPAPAAADAPPPPRRSRRSLRPADVAARHAPTGPVTRERRFAVGALGLGALLVLLLAVVVLRGTIGGGEDTKGVLPTATAAADVETATTPPRTVVLRIVPTEASYMCVADGSTGAKLWEGTRTGPYTVRRASLFLRIGVGTAQITVDGRPLQVDVAPSTYVLTAAGVRPAAGRSACAG
ncbi:hypothetical protein [Conexibacter sp. CPCC 206217]|uniref:hypothetical protein n=1 Tax=Conexibacter sp. CPCC 206217 TaxID=3064574 RepID=UPI002719F3FD|nr:hypothetical protein [Conexibacter sp. CPCC 206217]MDO8212782.1 hypothetical protein [Conexibacter sp. CPCC 206217]